MARDDELFDIAKKNKEAFFPGGHATVVDALRVLLVDGWEARWEDRSDTLRWRCGFFAVSHPEGKPHPEKQQLWPKETDWARMMRAKDGAGAWKLLAESPALDPDYLGDVDKRLAKAPEDIMAAVKLAAAPARMRLAEERVREAFERGAAFGVRTCPRIEWRAGRDHPDSIGRSSSRRALWPALAPIHAAYGPKANTIARDAQRDFSSSSERIDVPRMLSWTAGDYGSAVLFDRARSEGVVSGDSPFESLLRAAYLGFLVEEVGDERVVLVAT